MDDQRMGHVLRALRQRKGWRQQDVGDRAGVSDTLVARIERGAFASIPLGKIRRVAETLGARYDTILRWQAPGIRKIPKPSHIGSAARPRPYPTRMLLNSARSY